MKVSDLNETLSTLNEWYGSSRGGLGDAEKRAFKHEEAEAEWQIEKRLTAAREAKARAMPRSTTSQQYKISIGGVDFKDKTTGDVVKYPSKEKADAAAKTIREKSWNIDKAKKNPNFKVEVLAL